MVHSKEDLENMSVERLLKEATKLTNNEKYYQKLRESTYSISSFSHASPEDILSKEESVLYCSMVADKYGNNSRNIFTETFIAHCGHMLYILLIGFLLFIPTIAIFRVLVSDLYLGGMWALLVIMLLSPLIFGLLSLDLSSEFWISHGFAFHETSKGKSNAQWGARSRFAKYIYFPFLISFFVLWHFASPLFTTPITSLFYQKNSLLLLSMIFAVALMPSFVGYYIVSCTHRCAFHITTARDQIRASRT